jgi:hypothetical protein
MNGWRQRGTTTVVFAFIGATALIVLFAAIEVGRALFVVNALNESTRRGARMAAVCPLNDPAIAEVALFNTPGGGSASPVIGGLTAANVLVEYLGANGDPTGTFNNIRFVRVRIVDFQHQMLIPFASYIFTAPPSATTLPRESLGIPRDGTVQAC